MPQQDDYLRRIAHDVGIIKGWVALVGMLFLISIAGGFLMWAMPLVGHH